MPPPVLRGSKRFPRLPHPSLHPSRGAPTRIHSVYFQYAKLVRTLGSSCDYTTPQPTTPSGESPRWAWG